MFCLLSIQVKTEAKKHIYQSASELVEDAMQQFVQPEQPNVCNPKNITRAANRVRAKIRPEEPKDLEFEVRVLARLVTYYFLE